MPPTPKPKRGWFRRLLRWVGLLLLVLVVFHRPLFHFTLRTALHLLGPRMHLALDLHTSGSIFTNLTITDVHARANGTGKTPIRSIDIDRMRLDYSIPSLIKHGVGELLQSYELLNATIVIDALPSGAKKETEDETREKFRIAKLLNDILGQPAAYADRVKIGNFNITVNAPTNVTEVKGFNLLLDPENAGYLRIARLAVPGVPVWENLSAETSYVERNFFIKSLRLAPELVLDEVNFDASQRAQNKGSVILKAHLFGGSVALTLTGEQLAKGGNKLPNSYNTKLELEIADVAIDRAAEYFKAPKPPVAKLAKLSVLFSGEPEEPQTWRGNFGARVETIAAGTVKVDAAELHATFDQGRADITAVNLAAGANDVGLTARIKLPETISGFPRSEIDATLKIAAPDLPALTAMLPEPFSGAVNGGGTMSLRGGVLSADLALDAQKIANQGLGVGTGKLALRVTKQLDPPTTAFDALDAKISADFSELRVQTFTADTLKLDAETRNRVVKLNTLELRRGENFVTADGNAKLPTDPKDIAKMPVDAKFAIHVPQLGAFGVAVNKEALTGQIEGGGALKVVEGALTGGLKIEGGAFALGGFKAERLAAKIDVANNEAVIDQLALQLTDSNQLVITGKAGLAKPFTYEGGLLLDLPKLAALQPLLKVFGQKQPLAGALALQWNGGGQADPAQHSGDLNLALTKAKYGAIELSEVSLAGHYTPEFAESQPFRVVIGATAVGGVIEFRESKLRLRDLSVTEGKTPVLSGYVFLPFNPANTKQPVPLDQRLAANISTDKLDVEKLLGSFGQKSPVAGTVTANFVVSGTALQPFAHLKVSVERIQAKAAPKELAPADLVLEVHFSNNDLSVAATVKQPQVQPLVVKGHVPLDLEATMKAGKLDPAMPLELSAQLPASSLVFVPKLAPAVRRIEGTAALDVRVGGTLGKPAISGGAAVELKTARMVDENLPSIGAFHAKLAFAENALKFERFDGEVGGGTFKLGGTIGLVDPKDPVFALRLESKEILVKRDDSITVRADTDIHVDGPLKAGAVSGTVFIVHSRFFKEIDILPISLPGKAKPAPKSASAGPRTISFPQPPIRDWKFDLTIKTREDDPFLIRGNLANGAAAVSLKLGGTGLEPYLEGTVTIKQFVASLPFSTLSVTNGFVAFNKDQPFQPSIEIQAESQVRDHLVHAFIYGKANAPQVQLSSEPPLPHADLVSLLATGTTTSELAGSADALASRAALLAVKQLYTKIFKKGAAPPPDTKTASAGSIRDRFDLQLGALDNRSNTQEVSARFKVNDQTYLLGDIAVDGSFTGSLKYLIRFR